MTIESAKKVLDIEARAIQALADKLGDEFTRSVDIILGCRGKVVVVGIGKSGLVGRKIAATLASTGTPSFFVHPAEGVHGDVGMVGADDVVLFISNSGETEELAAVLPVFKRMGLPIVSLLGKPDSTLGRASDAVIDVSVPEEACPLQLAPTASTTATLAMGDALALALLEKRGFTADDFALLHPAGSLGKKLLLRVSDLMHEGTDMPVITSDSPLKEVVLTISSKMLGHAAVVDGGKLVGVVSDGDLRRTLENKTDFGGMKAGDLMTGRPKFITPDKLAATALQVMERYSITALLVCDDDAGENLVGIIHLHDLLKAGVV